MRKRKPDEWKWNYITFSLHEIQVKQIRIASNRCRSRKITCELVSSVSFFSNEHIKNVFQERNQRWYRNLMKLNCSRNMYMQISQSSLQLFTLSFEGNEFRIWSLGYYSLGIKTCNSIIVQGIKDVGGNVENIMVTQKICVKFRLIDRGEVSNGFSGSSTSRIGWRAQFLLVLRTTFLQLKTIMPF